MKKDLKHPAWHMAYGKSAQSSFARWLAEQGPEPFDVTPVIFARLVEMGWTPPEDSEFTAVSLDELCELAPGLIRRKP